MSASLAIVVFIALNVIPADVGVFDIAIPSGRTVNGKPVEKVICFTKKEGGKWRAVDLPDDELGEFSLEGNKLSVSLPEDEKNRGKRRNIAMPMEYILKLPEDLDWASVKTFELTQEGQVAISRKKNDVSVDVSIKAGNRTIQQVFAIRWKEKARK